MTHPRALAILVALVLAEGALPVPFARAADPVLVGAGDIADCTVTGDSATADLLDGIGGTVVTLGDNVYRSGTAAEFDTCYAETWGRHKARTRPATGNHDYLTAGASGYFGYFGSAAGDPKKGYYSYDLGTWHIVVLNSNCDAIGGCSATSPQGYWLRANLAANMDKDVLAYWHHPRYSSGTHGANLAMRPFWEILYAAGADVVLNGHDHDYERFARQDPWGRGDTPFGVREFVVGTGGAELRPLASKAANSQAFSSTSGVLRLTLRKGAYDWEFVPIAGSTFRDAGTTVTHGPPPARTTTSFVVGTDAYVDEAHPATNYGTATLLRIDNDAGAGMDRRAYLKATVSGVTGVVDRAFLRLWVTNATTDGPKTYPTTTAWSGETLTWRNRPAATGPAASDVGAIPAGAWTELDVTSIVRGNGTFGFLLYPTSSDGLDVESRQGTHRPTLVVQAVPAAD